MEEAVSIEKKLNQSICQESGESRVVSRCRREELKRKQRKSETILKAYRHKFSKI